jgi:hypothetical protein
MNETLDVDALQLLPENDPLQSRDVQLGCSNTVGRCALTCNPTCKFTTPCSLSIS